MQTSNDHYHSVLRFSSQEKTVPPRTPAAAPPGWSSPEGGGPRSLRECSSPRTIPCYCPRCRCARNTALHLGSTWTLLGNSLVLERGVLETGSKTSSRTPGQVSPNGCDAGPPHAPSSREGNAGLLRRCCCFSLPSKDSLPPAYSATRVMKPAASGSGDLTTRRISRHRPWAPNLPPRAAREPKREDRPARPRAPRTPPGAGRRRLLRGRAHRSWPGAPTAPRP